MDGGLKSKIEIRSIFCYHESYLDSFGKDSKIFRNIEVDIDRIDVMCDRISK